jgi:hypothetical protein
MNIVTLRQSVTRGADRQFADTSVRSHRTNATINFEQALNAKLTTSKIGIPISGATLTALQDAAA